MKTEVITNKMKAAFNTAGRISIIACSMAIGFGVCKLVENFKRSNAPEVHTIPPTQSIQSVSIAVNERGELMMIDRKNGSFQIYSDTVGRTIFNIYAGQMYAKMGSK